MIAKILEQKDASSKDRLDLIKNVVLNFEAIKDEVKDQLTPAVVAKTTEQIPLTSPEEVTEKLQAF